MTEKPDLAVIATAATSPRQGWLRLYLTSRPLLPYQFLLLFGFLTAWQIGADASDLTFWISSPREIAIELSKWWQSGQLGLDLRVTLFEAGTGFVLGSVCGALVGFMLGWSRRIGDLLEPFIVSLYTLPKIALAPLFVLWFGIGPLNKVMFASLLVFYMVFFTTFQGTRQVDPDLVVNAKLLGARPFHVWTKIAIPYSAVWLFSGLRIGLPYALIGAIVGEFVAAQAGVGYRIKEATAYFNTAGVFAGLIVLMAISLTMLALLKLSERRAFRWKVTQGQTEPH